MNRIIKILLGLMVLTVITSGIGSIVATSEKVDIHNGFIGTNTNNFKLGERHGLNIGSFIKDDGLDNKPVNVFSKLSDSDYIVNNYDELSNIFDLINEGNISGSIRVVLNASEYVFSGKPHDVLRINRTVNNVNLTLTPADNLKSAPVFDCTVSRGIDVENGILNINGVNLINGNTRTGFIVTGWNSTKGQLNMVNCNVTNSHAIHSCAGVNLNTSNNNIINCSFINNVADRDAGAINLNGENNTIIGCSFINNSIAKNESSNYTNNGGAIYINKGNNLISGSFFSGNHALKNGGAIYINSNNNIVTDSNFNSNSAADDGGAIYINYDAKDNSVNNATFNSNSAADDGGAIYIYYGAKDNSVNNAVFNSNLAADDGGAIYINYGAKDNSVNNVVFNSNSAVNNGGAINSYDGRSVNVNGSEFKDNHANSNGGGIYLKYGDFKIENSLFSNNIAKNGGGIDNQFGEVKIANSSFTGNNATAGDYYSGGGGAIKNLGILTVDKSSFKSNTATNSYSIRGGAVATSNDTEITNTNFVDNSAKSGGASGGAIKVWNSCKFVIKDSTFKSNTAHDFGGAIDFDNLISIPYYSPDPGISQGNNYNASLINLKFVNNNATWGGAIEAYGGTTKTEDIGTQNCEFINNTATGHGGAIDIHSNACFKIVLNGANKHFIDYFTNNNGSQGEDIYISSGAKFEPKLFYDEGKDLKRIIG
jgi:predicted outer membrane repeat protein